jgi:hypothetical protein
MKSHTSPEVLKLATQSIPTSILKEKLNSFYTSARTKPILSSQKEHFDYLWDLKEKAIMEGIQTVEVPEEWISELDGERSSTRSH